MQSETKRKYQNVIKEIKKKKRLIEKSLSENESVFLSSLLDVSFNDFNINEKFFIFII